MLRDLRDGFGFMLRTPWLLWTLLFASMFVLVVLGPIEVLLPFIAKDRFADGAQDVRLHPGVLRDGQCAGCAGGVVGAAAAPLPDGDDGDVGPRLHPAGGRRRRRRRSR